MMLLLRDLPIRRKLVVILMIATGGALFLAGAGLLALDYFRFRREMVTDLETLAEIVAQNTTAPLSFHYPDAAEETLAALDAKPSVLGASVYDKEGAPFAKWARKGAHPDFPARPGPEGSEFRQHTLALFEPVVLEGDTIGTVYLESSLSEIAKRLRFRFLTMTAVFLVSALAALALSSGLQGLISKPVLHLAETARAVSEGNDYSLRAEKQSSDELGRLVDAFNQMLSQIEERDSALQSAKDDLEHRVQARTSELRVANDELQQSNRELDDFAYVASHDLKEPLRGIHNYSMFLLEDYADKLDAEGKSKLETLMRLTRRMEVLIDSLLRYSRLGRIDLTMEEVDLNELVAEVRENLDINLKAEQVEVIIPRRLPGVLGDRVQLGEIFHNLIVNGVKYNESQRKRIEIGYRDARDSQPPVFFVRDNGIGIPDKHYDVIFRIFKRLHARDKYGGGTGAGLTIVKKIVERHNGSIWVESTPGEGTTFYFTLAKGDSLAEQQHSQPTNPAGRGQS
jgi:signal transduction histidine kinase